ncbi:aldehyde dehydrogenase (NADP(+)) [Pseudonocardia sp. MH-G8]|uniref:aldehyde dehydrogenase (NADP(+)) n=1 Tax=Pseudonocardia sp. MH-G8 TaxID=1854588 RepID=UPI000BA11BB3|nr:aldehyde dehydrogenase (NADP(+)) [Pseudonocardia sp. MH-G8]OZM83233.1 aldehyde dehydrogenase (NADP(+)) [Pseudonocardia sp. MH-G8]
MIASIDPRTGRKVEEVGTTTSASHLDDLCVRATAAAQELVALGRRGRAGLLRSMAAALQERRTDLVAVADRETALGEQRLGGELTRTCYQLELFADVLDDGAYLEATIDHAGDTPMGPRPDLRRMLVPLGPVAVFGASNFPFAFSVPGGDTASALAAGCPVIAKVHGAHPATSVLSHEALVAGAVAAGVTPDVINLVFGREAGVELVKRPAVHAVGFTGSLDVGRLLFDIASSRPSPIPFYGELGALNTLTVCPGAAAERGEDIAAGLTASFTLGVGQFCTKPGVALLPAGPAGEAIRRGLTERVEAMAAGFMLSERTARSYRDGTETLRGLPGVRVLASGAGGGADGWTGAPLLLQADADAVTGALTEECFGPVLVTVDYTSEEHLLELLRGFGPALTGTIHADAADAGFSARVYDQLGASVGRVVWNGFPTGVAVAWGMQHGGPYPATTNALHTSVGTTAIRRWVRPISLQNVPQNLLPDELRDTPADAAGLVRRIDGVLTPVTE